MKTENNPNYTDFVINKGETAVFEYLQQMLGAAKTKPDVLVEDAVRGVRDVTLYALQNQEKFTCGELLALIALWTDFLKGC